jgi:hypothetical protein
LVFVNVPLNADEAMFLASAIKFSTNMNTWLSVDTATSGPVNIYPLMWPFLFGADTGFAAARITAVALLGSTWLLVVSALESTSCPARICIGACLILFLGGTQVLDFTHYSSEIVPVFLLMCALRITFIGVERPLTTAQIAIAGLSLGLAPFAKLQAAILGLGIGVILLWQVFNRSHRPHTSCAFLILCASLPALILLAPLAAAGGLFDFWTSYVGFSMNYLGGGWGEIQHTNQFKSSIRALLAIFRERLIGGYLLVMALITLFALTTSVRQLPSRRQALIGSLKNPQLVRWAIALAVLGLSTWTVMAPARVFLHYLFFILWPAALVAGFAWSLAIPQHGNDAVRSRRYDFIGGVSVLIILVLTVRQPIASYDLDVVAAGSLSTTGQLLPSVDAKRGRMLVWGWMPQFHVWSGWTPATRDMYSYKQIWPTPLRDYFRGRLMDDLRSDPPEYIVDAVAKGSFGFADFDKYGISTFPELASYVAENYELVSRGPPDNSCPRVFARKSTVTALKQRFAVPSRVYASFDRASSAAAASANRVADGIVFETCPDAWQLEDGEQVGEITLDLESAQELEAIEILNTRGGPRGDRATKAVRVMAYNRGELVMDRSVPVPRFPYWAEIALPDAGGFIDRLTVRIKSFAGAGGGLNEIRLRKRK